MYGIHEVSIAKAAVGWLVFVVYAVQVVMLVMGWNAQKRMWRVKGAVGDEADGETGHGEAKVVVIGLDGKSKTATKLQVPGARTN